MKRIEIFEFRALVIGDGISNISKVAFKFNDILKNYDVNIRPDGEDGKHNFP